MKVIDLLNKIANGEEVPHFKVGEIEYFLNWRGNLLEREGDKPIADVQWFIDEDWLNTEVEIIEDTFSGIKFYQNGEETCSIDTRPSFTTKDLHIEEDKEDMNIVKIDTGFFYTLGTEERDGLLKEKINEIIDKLNKEE
jgi:hypothetical protein